MLNREDFYRTHGIRFVKDLISPIVWSSEILTFPKKTMLVWVNSTLTKEYPTYEYGYFKHLNSPRVYSILEYGEGINKGAPKYKLVNENKVIRKCKLKEPGFKYIKANKSVTVPTNSEVLFNLGVVSSGYKYISHPLTPYHVWYNSLSTAVSLCTIKRTGNNRHKYLFINLPNNIPPIALIKKHLGEVTRSTLRNFGDNTYLNILELFRFIDVEHKQHSIIANTLTEGEFQYTDLVLNINNKSTIINLEILASITDAYDLSGKLKKYPSKTVIKLMYIFLNKILDASPILTTDQVASSSLVGITSSADNPTDTSELSLDDIINNEIVGKDVVAEESSVDDIINDNIKEIASDVVIENTNGNSVVDLDTDTVLTDNTFLVDTLDGLASDKIITKKSRTDLVEVLEEQKTKKSPYNDGTTLASMLTNTTEEIELDTKSVNIEDSPSVMDKSSNRDPLNVLNAKYHKETLRKDILGSIYSIQKAGIIIKDHDVKVLKTILGETEEHTLTLQTLDGGRSTIRIKLPVIQEDNTFKLSNNTYVMRRQRADIPLKKISNNIVSLNSYYGKLFISRAIFKKDDLGFWFHKQLLAKYEVDKDLKDIAALTVVSPDAIVPKHYGLIGRYVKGFTYKGIEFRFDYINRGLLLKNMDLSKIEKSGTLVGVKNNIPVVMDSNDVLILLDANKTVLGTVFELLELDTSKAPIEYCNAKVYKKQIPIVVLLSYYVGFSNLLKILGVSYVITDTGKRVIINKDQYRVVFKDKTFIMDRDYGVNDLILAGFRSIAKPIKSIMIDSLESRSSFHSLFTAMELPLLYINEIKLMESMFIDPITKQILELYKYPTTFRGVLVKAADMLQDDNYKHPNSIDGAILKGYERISGMLYAELVSGIRINNNKSHFGKSKLVVNPYSILNRINEDSTTVLVDDLNPLATLKQHEDVTYLGSHGRKEETMSEATRSMHSSEIGIISEAVKDSGAVGISAYLSAAPNITTTRGTVSKSKDTDGWTTRLSTSAMLAPFGTKDDPKRLVFVSIQNAHVIPMQRMEAPYVRTGYESIFAVRSPSKFVVSAVEPGEVVSVSKEAIVVRYAKSGKKTYSLKEWTSKEEAGTTYTHKLVGNLTKGTKFSKDDTLAYDKAFYEPDIFNTNRVIYRQGGSITTVLMEAPETYEDSGSISKDTAKVMGTTTTKVKSITLVNTDNILDPSSVGDKLEVKSPLLSIVDEAISNLTELDDKALEVLKGLKRLTPKAGYRGVVSKIRVYYNCDFSELTRSLKKLAKVSDEELMDTDGHTGQVDGSYSIQGVPLLAGSVEIKYYIEVGALMGTGDKAILGNQLKFTIGDVFEKNIVTEDGTVVDCIFSGNSIEARIVNSPGLIGTTSKVLEVLKDKVVSDYFS